jgi:hypothetical protein
MLASLWIYTPNPKGPGEAQEMWGMVVGSRGRSGFRLSFILAPVWAENWQREIRLNEIGPPPELKNKRRAEPGTLFCWILASTDWPTL